MSHSCAPALPMCHLTTQQQPYLTLAPLRVETVCEEPYLVIFHDILTEQEMTYMKSHVLKDLMVATVVDRSVEGGDGKRVSNERTQSSGWLWDTVRRSEKREITFLFHYSGSSTPQQAVQEDRGVHQPGHHAPS